MNHVNILQSAMFSGIDQWSSWICLSHKQFGCTYLGNYALTINIVVKVFFSFDSKNSEVFMMATNQEETFFQ